MLRRVYVGGRTSSSQAEYLRKLNMTGEKKGIHKAQTKRQGHSYTLLESNPCKQADIQCTDAAAWVRGHDRHVNRRGISLVWSLRKNTW